MFIQWWQRLDNKVPWELALSVLIIIADFTTKDSKAKTKDIANALAMNADKDLKLIRDITKILETGNYINRYKPKGQYGWICGAKYYATELQREELMNNIKEGINEIISLIPALLGQFPELNECLNSTNSSDFIKSYQKTKRNFDGNGYENLLPEIYIRGSSYRNEALQKGIDIFLENQ